LERFRPSAYPNFNPSTLLDIPCLPRSELVPRDDKLGRRHRQHRDGLEVCIGLQDIRDRDCSGQPKSGVIRRLESVDRKPAIDDPDRRVIEVGRASGDTLLVSVTDHLDHVDLVAFEVVGDLFSDRSLEFALELGCQRRATRREVVASRFRQIDDWRPLVRLDVALEYLLKLPWCLVEGNVVLGENLRDGRELFKIGRARGR
jgi:hypothetical protein